VRRRAGSSRILPCQPPLGSYQIRGRGSPKTSISGPLPTADQRNGRYDPLVFLAPLFLGGALLLAMFFFVAPAVFLAALFLAPI
jgi:hypothetical protein